jgi:hypothetical protein
MEDVVEHVTNVLHYRAGHTTEPVSPNLTKNRHLYIFISYAQAAKILSKKRCRVVV